MTINKDLVDYQVEEYVKLYDENNFDDETYETVTCE